VADSAEQNLDLYIVFLGIAPREVALAAEYAFALNIPLR